MTTILKAGHAVLGIGSRAHPTASVSSWHTRYVVLTGTCICGYPDLNSLSKPLACIVIIPETTAEIVTGKGGSASAGALGSAEFRVFVKDPAGNHFIFVLNSIEEQLAWVDSIRRAVRLSRFALKAYVTTVLRKGILATKSRKYFVLDNNNIYRHRDYDRVWEIETQFKFDLSTKTIYTDSTNTISLRNRGAVDNSLELCFEDNKTNYLQWKDIIVKMVTASEEGIEKIKTAIAGALKTDTMYFMFDHHGGHGEWRECSVTLTLASLILQEVGDSTHNASASSNAATTTASPLSPAGSEPSPPHPPRSFDPAKCIDILDFAPDSTCAETSESLCSFLVTNRGKMLHLREGTSHNMRTWIKSIHQCISHCGARKRDNILSYGVRLIKEDIFYSITINNVGPLGFDLAATDGGWVIVNSAESDCGVSKGSVLTSVQNKNVVMLPASETLQLLVAWAPPLTLHFRKAPEKVGYLFEKYHGTLGSKWKKKYFRIFCGQLERLEDHHGVAVNVFPLSGAAAFEIKDGDSATQRILCFRFVSGQDSLVLQAESSEDLLAWLGHLCHGIAIASGGSFVRRVEQARVARLADMKQRGASNTSYRRQPTIGLLNSPTRPSFNSELTSFQTEHDDMSVISNRNDHHGNGGGGHLHDEEQWWWAMGGNNDELSSLVVRGRAENADGDDSELASDQSSHTKDLLSDADIYGRSTNVSGVGFVSNMLDKKLPSKLDDTSGSTKLHEEQMRIQDQLSKIQGDTEASKELVLVSLKKTLRAVVESGLDSDVSELEGLVDLAKLWAVSGPEMDRATEIVSIRKKALAAVNTPPRKSLVRSKNLLLPRSASKIAAAQRHIVSLCGEHPVNSPTHDSYEWNNELKVSVENAVLKGTYLCPESVIHTKVDDWKGVDSDEMSSPPTMQCVASTTLDDKTLRSKLFVMDSCVQVYLNHIFIRELKTEGDKKVLLANEDTGLLLSNFDLISVCESADHHSVLLRVNLHASADVSRMRTHNDSPLLSQPGSPSGEVVRPIVKWVGRREGELHSNIRAAMSSYLVKFQKLVDMNKDESYGGGAVGPLSLNMHQSFAAAAEQDTLEKVDYSNLHLRTAPEGRLEIEIQCKSQLERDTLYLSIVYLVSQADGKDGEEVSLVPRDMSLRDRLRCLPWTVRAAFNESGGISGLSPRENEYEMRIRKLEAEMALLTAKHAMELKAKDKELAKLRDQLEGGRAADVL